MLSRVLHGTRELKPRNRQAASRTARRVLRGTRELKRGAAVDSDGEPVAFFAGRVS